MENRSDEIEALAEKIVDNARATLRFMIAIAGPPGTGKSTLAAELSNFLPNAAVIGMDGFHYDDAVLARMGLAARKGAPETFDFDGLEALLHRLRDGNRDVAVPVFDRAVELSRAAADIVPAGAKFLVIEGNYLLLDEEPWSRLSTVFDFTIFLDIERDLLVQRLMARWLNYGRTHEAARNWIETNDMRNANRVWSRRRPANVIRFSRGTTGS